LTGKLKLAVRDITVLALCAALLFAQQVALAALPNIELVSLLVMLFTLTFRLKVLYIIYAFALLQGLYWGFDLWWWPSYLYVWTILAGLTWLFRANKAPLMWAVLSGFFGLFFGLFFAIPRIFIGGWAAALAYWIAGIPFDLIHCAGNFVLCLVLWTPLQKALKVCIARLKA
jgi:energy-coupling factor transport system substrate-specific component